MINVLYTIFATIGSGMVILEITGKIKEGLVIIKSRRGANAVCRTAKVISFVVIAVQSTALMLGVFCGFNNFVPVIMIMPIGFLYGWHIYLGFKYKRKPFNPFIVN